MRSVVGGGMGEAETGPPDLLATVGPVILDGVSDLWVVLDRQERVVACNRQAAALFGREPADLVGRHVWTEWPDGRGRPFHAAYERAVREGARVDFLDHVRRWDRWFASSFHPFEAGCVVVTREVTQQKRAERRLEEEVRARSEALALLQTLVDAAPDGIALLDRDLRYRAVNAKLAAMNGRSVDQHLGRSMPEVLGALADYPLECARAVLDTGLPVLDVEVSGVTDAAPGATREWLVDYYPVTEGQELLGVGVIVREVTAQRAAERELLRQATHDDLTGLANRALFLDLLARSLAAPGPQDGVVVALGIDRFKLFNESLGRAAGDALLRRVAARLRGALRPEDTLARIGGDEFAVLVAEGLDVAGARRLAERLQEALDTPFETLTPVRVAVSVGIADTRPAGDPATPAARALALLERAEVAMYRARGDGGSTIAVYDDAMQHQSRERLRLEARLRDDVAGELLDVHYQPIVDLTAGRVTGLEALARWTDSESGPVPPDRFIPIAEEAGLIGRVGGVVAERAVRDLGQWRATLPAGQALTVAVNLSPVQVLDGAGLLAGVDALLRDSGLPPSALCFEVTESALFAEPEASLATLAALRSLGVELAMDDFGTGWSSLSRFAALPVQTVKIDKSFTWDLVTSAQARHVVHAILAMARGLGLRTVAEGIETPDQLELLRDLGCDRGQGYLFSPPVPAGQVAPLLRRMRA